MKTFDGFESAKPGATKQGIAAKLIAGLQLAGRHLSTVNLNIGEGPLRASDAPKEYMNIPDHVPAKYDIS